MKKSFKRILGVCAISSLLALTFTSCQQPTGNTITDVITTYTSVDETVKLTIKEDAETGSLEVTNSTFYGYSTNESCCLKPGKISSSNTKPADYYIEYATHWEIVLDNKPYKVERAEIWLNQKNGKAAVKFWTDKFVKEGDNFKYTTSGLIKLFTQDYFEPYSGTVNIAKLDSFTDNITPSGSLFNGSTENGKFTFDNTSVKMTISDYPDLNGNYFVYSVGYELLPKGAQMLCDSYNVKFFILNTNDKLTKVDVVIDANGQVKLSTGLVLELLDGNGDGKTDGPFIISTNNALLTSYKTN